MNAHTHCQTAPGAYATLPSTRFDLASAWERLLAFFGWRELRLDHARAELLRLADRLEATEPSYASDLRAAALAGVPGYSSSTVRGQLDLSSRDNARSASSLPSFWQRAQ